MATSGWSDDCHDGDDMDTTDTAVRAELQRRLDIIDKEEGQHVALPRLDLAACAILVVASILVGLLVGAA